MRVFCNPKNKSAFSKLKIKILLPCLSLDHNLSKELVTKAGCALIISLYFIIPVLTLYKSSFVHNFCVVIVCAGEFPFFFFFFFNA